MSIAQLNEQELKTTADQIILVCAAITGCPVPQTEFFADVITKQMISYLNEFGYNELTLDEITLAIKLNTANGLRYPSGAEVERVVFSGACFSVDFLARILANYMALRNSLDRKLENFIDGY